MYTKDAVFFIREQYTTILIVQVTALRRAM